MYNTVPVDLCHWRVNGNWRRVSASFFLFICFYVFIFFCFLLATKCNHRYCTSMIWYDIVSYNTGLCISHIKPFCLLQVKYCTKYCIVERCCITVSQKYLTHAGPNGSEELLVVSFATGTTAVYICSNTTIQHGSSNQCGNGCRELLEPFRERGFCHQII